MRAKTIVLIALSVIAVQWVLPAPAGASIHAPVSFAGNLSEARQQALLFSDGDYCHLVLTTSLRCPTGLPATVAWLIPLPGVPLHTDALARAFFSQLAAVTGTENEAPLSSATRPNAPALPDYRITVLRLENAGSTHLVNGWLQSHNFKEAGSAELEPYLRPDAAFVAVEVQGLKGTAVQLPPLHLVFRADLLTMPLKTSVDSGVFDVTLYLVTVRPVSMTMLKRSKLLGRQSVRLTRTSPAPLLLRMLSRDPGFLTSFSGEDFNTPGRFVRDLDADPAIAPDAAR